MFELTIKCSKDVKKIVIDFGDNQTSTTELVDDISSPASSSVVSKGPVAQDMSDILASRSVSTSASVRPVKNVTKNTTDVAPPVPDIANRPPKVDDDFNVEF